MAPTLAARASLHLAHAHRHSLRECVTFAQLLVLDSAQVEARVSAELETNPALVRSDRQQCVGCGAWTTGNLCCSCRPIGYPAEPAAPAPGLRQQILTDLLTTCHSSRDRVIAHHLVASLDGSGFLTEPVEQLAATLGQPVAAVEATRARLVGIGPPGIAVADVRERLQALAAVAATAPPDGVAALLAGDIRSLLRPDDPAAAACLDWVRRHLDPHLDLDEATAAEPVRPADLVVTDGHDGLTVRPWGLAHDRVEVDAEFAALTRDAAALLTDEDLALARAQVDRARALVACLAGRTRTVVRVAEVVVARQARYIRCGAAEHVPMTRAALAVELGLHESTVGRAVKGTTLQLPDHSVRELASFFGGRQAALSALAGLLRDHPVAGDGELAERLTGSGFRVARRTVAKYRYELAANAASR